MTLHLTHLRSDVSQLGLALRGGASDLMVMIMIISQQIGKDDHKILWHFADGFLTH